MATGICPLLPTCYTGGVRRAAPQQAQRRRVIPVILEGKPFVRAQPTRRVSCRRTPRKPFVVCARNYLELMPPAFSDRLQPIPSPLAASVELPSVLESIVPETGRTLSAPDVPLPSTPPRGLVAVDIFLEGYYNVRERKIGGFSVVNRGGNSRYVGCFERSLVGKLMEFAGRREGGAGMVGGFEDGG